MEKRILKWAGLLVFAGIFLQGCMADLRTDLIKQEGISAENVNKGKSILDRAWETHGFDHIENYKVYSFQGSDTWKGLMGRTGKIWPDAKSELQFKFQVGTFDGQVTFLDGKRKGEKAGLQNWQYYETISGKDPQFMEINKKVSFGLAAYQYFTEMVGRLRKAPIISYAGEQTLRGQQYDLVFCTWHKAEPHKEADQYIAWINKETGLLDFTQYTIRENYLKAPGGKAVYGGVEFSDYKNIEGVMIAHEHTVYVFNLKEKKEKNLHQLIISDFTFDDFELEELRPDKTLEEGGDFKHPKTSP